MSTPRDWVDYLSALSTPMLAFFGIYIAWRQWRTAELKRKQDLFDKRYEIFEETMSTIREAEVPNLNDVQTANAAKINPDRIPVVIKLRSLAAKIEFLFNSKLADRIWEVISQIKKYYSAEIDHFDTDVSQRKNFEPERQQNKQFFIQIVDTIHSGFAKDLSMEEKFINWRCGLFRVCIVISIYWIIGMVCYQYNSYDWVELNGQPLNKLNFVLDWHNLLYMFLPPLILFLLYNSGLWIGHGLKTHKG